MQLILLIIAIVTVDGRVVTDVLQSKPGVPVEECQKAGEAIVASFAKNDKVLSATYFCEQKELKLKANT